MTASDSLLDKAVLNVMEKDVIKKKVTNRDVEKYEVAQLDGHIVPCSRPSDLFDKLEERRKIRHENILHELSLSLHEVNSKTEKNITTSSLELKAHFKDFDDKLKNILNNIDKPEAASYCASVFLGIQNKAKEFKCEKEKLVKEVHEDLIKFENERAKENEKLLHLACEEIRKVGYFLPYEVQAFVEKETLKMNQLSLNNRRCYEDLRLTLTLLTEQAFKSFMDEVFCIQGKWVQFRLQEALQNLQNRAEVKIAKLAPEAYARLELKGRELILQLSPDNVYSTCKAEEWSRNVEEVLAAIDCHGKNLIDVYKKALNAVFHGFDKEVEEIKTEMDFVETLAIEERIIKPIVFETQNDHIKEIEGLEMFWQETLSDIKSHLKELTQFLLDAGKLWDRHMERVCESKKLILRALEKADKNNQAFFQDMEVKLNLSLDGLRQEHNQGKLEKAYEAVIVTLNSLKSKYETIYLEDVATIEDFYKMMDLEADVLSAELKEFIYEVHPVDHGRNMMLYVDQHRLLPDGRPIFKEIQMGIQQIQAVRTWKLGVWTALETFAEKTRESLQPRAENWVKTKIENLAEKVSIQMELLEKRMQRIKIEMFEKRLTEIASHQETFEKHKEKVKFSLAQMKENLRSLIGKEVSKINYIKESLNELEANAKLEDRPGVIRGNQLMMERKKEELESDLKESFERFQADCETKTSDIRQANVQFMRSIKFFHENGNYSTEEGKMFMTMLEAVDKEINTELKTIVKDCTKEENDSIKKLSLFFGPPIALMNSLFEETLFYQEIQERLQGLKTEIRNVAKTVRLNFDFLKAQSDSLRNFVQNLEEPVSELDEKFWHFIIQLFYRNVCNLFYPVVYPYTPATSANEEEGGEYESGEGPSLGGCCCAGKLALHISISKTATFRTAEKVDSITYKDYRNQLFNSENPPEDNGTFMAVVSNSFWEEMDFLQKAACVFYKKLQGRKIIREDLIPVNYEMFVGEILAKFKYYNIQVEQFWLQMVLEFLPVIECLKSAANRFIERQLQDYENLAFKALKEYEHNFRSCLECQACENLKELEILDNKLLPLHGYPHNRDLLDRLEEEVVQRTAAQRIKWEAAIKKFKSQVKCFSFHHIKQLSEIKAVEVHHCKLKEKLFVDDFGNNLLDAIMEYCNRGGYCTKRTSTDSLKPKGTGNESQDLASGEVPSEHKLNFEDLTDEKVHGVQTYLNQLRRLVERERLSEYPPPECSPCTTESPEYLTARPEDPCAIYCEPKLNILMPIIPLEEPVGKMVERLEEYIRSMKAFADSQQTFHEEDLLKWLTIWKLNVKKVIKLFRVKYEEKPEVLEEPVQPPSGELLPILLLFFGGATVRIRSSQDKGKASRKGLSDGLLQAFREIPKLKSRSRGSRSVSNENKKRPGFINHSKTNLQKSKLTESKKSNQVGFPSNASLILLSPRNYHGQIPVLHRHSLNYLRMSPPVTRSPSPAKKLLPKEKSSPKMKTITLETKKKSKTGSPRSPSPVRKTPGSYKKTKSRTSTSPAPGCQKNSEKVAVRRAESIKQTTSPRINSPAKRKSKSKIASSSNVEFSWKGKPGKGSQMQKGDSSPAVLKQSSQPSLCVNEKLIQPQEKISLDHLKNEVYTGDRGRLSFEKVQVCIEKSMENLNVAESKRSFFVTYSSENVQQQKEISLAFLQNLSNSSIKLPTEGDKRAVVESKDAIRTLSGHELILTPSMKLDLEKDEISDNIEISQLLHETCENFDDQKEVFIPQDDANEYDSEMSTDGEQTALKAKHPSVTRISASNKSNDPHWHSNNSLWKSREAELLNDVDYRQSVYHPAVSRRQKNGSEDEEFKGKSQSIQDSFDFDDKATKSMVRSRTSSLKNKYAPQLFIGEKMNGGSNDRTWPLGFDKTDAREIYNSVLEDVPFYGMKRIRTKKERVSGALLHFTLKVIRLLAVFNLWPGDNCHMLTSQSLRFAR